MSFLKYTVSLMMIAIFSIALITFAINFAVDNDAAVSIGSDEQFAAVKTNSSSNVNEFYSGSATAYDAYQQSTVASTATASEGGTQFKVTPTTSLAMAKNSLSAGWYKIFGSDSGFGVVLTALIAMLTFIMAALAYQAWVGRNPGS
jgi:hypothetical protein